jgi:hypothetical protein
MRQAWLYACTCVCARMHIPQISLICVSCFQCFLSQLSLLQAGNEEMLQLPVLLDAVLAVHPESIATAAKADVAPGLFRVLRNLPRPSSERVIRTPFKCLRSLCKYDMTHDMVLPKLAHEAGMIPVFSELLKLGDEEALAELLSVAGSVLLTLPYGQSGMAEAAFMHDIAAFLTAEPLFAPMHALEGLFAIGIVRRDLIMDFATWGVADSVQRLTKHRDTPTAVAAKRLLFLVSDGLHVGSTLYTDSCSA